MAKQYIDNNRLKQMTKSSVLAIKRYSKLAELYGRLMIAGGKYIYLDPSDTAHWIDRYLENGEYITPRRISYEMVKKCGLIPLYCYDNLIQMYSRVRPPGGKPRVYIGYSLMMPEDLWIQHVWMYDGETIYESTPVESVKYFGIPITIREFRKWMADYRWLLPPEQDW